MCTLEMRCTYANLGLLLSCQWGALLLLLLLFLRWTEYIRNQHPFQEHDRNWEPVPRKLTITLITRARPCFSLASHCLLCIEFLVKFSNNQHRLLQISPFFFLFYFSLVRNNPIIPSYFLPLSTSLCASSSSSCYH